MASRGCSLRLILNARRSRSNWRRRDHSRPRDRARRQARIRGEGQGLWHRPAGGPDPNGLETENRLNLIWAAFPLGTTTGEDGRFIIRFVPRERVATLVVTESRHERLYTYAATTDSPQPPHIHSVLRSTGFTLTAKVTDHVLNGRVVFEADGKPAAGAVVIRDGSTYKADQNGRFRIDGLVAGELTLHASQDGSNTSRALPGWNYPRIPRRSSTRSRCRSGWF